MRIRPYIFSSLVLLLMTGSVFFLGADIMAQTSSQNEKKLISENEFISSDAGNFFRSGDYDQALKALDELLMKYPEDLLLIRYRAIALDNLGRSEEALAIYKQLLEANPTHVPTHYDLGQAYRRMGDIESAVREWRLVSEQAKGTPYESWARTSLIEAGETGQSFKNAKAFRGEITGRYGYKFDSNVTLKPSDDSIGGSLDSSASRHELEGTVRYPVYTGRDTTVDALYDVYQSLHDDSLNEFNFHSEEFGLHLRRRVGPASQNAIAGLRYDFNFGFLNGNFFSARNRWNLYLDRRFTSKTRTLFYDRISVAEFGPDGPEPSKTSRDGMENDLGITQYWYLPDQRYLFTTVEFNTADKQGNNFDMLGTTTRMGFHSSFVFNFQWDASAGLETGFYPNFSSVSNLDTSRRRDLNWDIYNALSYPLTRRLTLRLFYRYISADNQNNIYNYNRQIGGAELIWRQNF